MASALTEIRFVLPREDELQKARTHKYIRRWKGKDGKWQYEYADQEQREAHEVHLADKERLAKQKDVAASITERYDDAEAYDKLYEIGQNLFETQAASKTTFGFERDDVGLSLMDMQAWQRMHALPPGNARLRRVREILAKYKRQIVGRDPNEFEEYVRLGLWDTLTLKQVGDPARLEPEVNRFGGINLPLAGDRLKGEAWDNYRDTMRKYKGNGLRFDGGDRVWYVRAEDAPSFPWDQMRTDLEGFGIGFGDVPEIERTEPTAVKERPKAETMDADTVVEAIQRRQVDDTVAVTVIKEGPHKGKYAFYSTFSRDFNDIFSNKSGVLSGITEYVRELGHARVTDNRHLVDEALERIKERMPDHTVVVAPEVEAKQQAQGEALAEAQKPVPEVTARLAKGIELFPFQNAGTRFLIENDGNALIGDEMGLGKTMQTLAYAAAKGKRVLVVCPRVVRKNWLREATRFFPDYFNGRELKSADLKKHGQPDLSKDNIVTVNYESLHKFLPAIKAAGFDTIVVDESHRMKNPKAKITKTIKDVAAGMQHKILLSGTAIKNKKVELYEQLNLIKPGMFRSANELKMATTGGVWHKLKDVYLARQKKDVLKDLPPKVSSIVQMEVPLAQLPETPREIGEMSAAKQALAIAKTDGTSEYVKEMLASSDSNVLVFTDSKEAAEQLYAKIGSDVAVIHHGSHSDKHREEAVAHFDPSTRKPGDPKRVFIATTQSAGIGINLQTADKVVFNDLPWTPADLRQAEDRAYRIGTTSSVNVYWQTVEGHEFDELIADTIKKKYELSKKVLEGKQLSKEERAWMDKSVSPQEMIEALKTGKAPGEPKSVAVEAQKQKQTQSEPTVTVPPEDAPQEATPPSKAEGKAETAPQAPAPEPPKPKRPKRTAKPREVAQPPAPSPEQKPVPPKMVIREPAPSSAQAADTSHVEANPVPVTVRAAFEVAKESGGTARLQPGDADKIELWMRTKIGQTVGGGSVRAVGKNAWNWETATERVTLKRDRERGPGTLTHEKIEPPPAPSGDSMSDHAAKVAAYNAKLEAKRDRLRERADKARAESEARFKASDMSEAATGIPMGQPIIRGSKSEGAHRRTIERAHANLGRSIEADAKAKELDRRAAAVGSSGVSSGDPEAVQKLKAKLQANIDARDMMKKLNAAYKKHGQNWSAIQKQTGVSDKMMATLKRAVETMPHYEKAPYPSYRLTNVGAEIRRLKQRVESLQAEAARPAAAPIVGTGYRVEEAPDDNRIRFYFDEKPDRETTRKMRSAGFKWSPSEGAWQRHLNEAGRYAAERMAKELFGAAPTPAAPEAPAEAPASVPEPEEGPTATVEPKPEPKPSQTAEPAPGAHARARKPTAAGRRRRKLEAAGQMALFKSRRPRFVISVDGFDIVMRRVDRLIKSGHLNGAMELIKAAGHKYLRRIPTGDAKRRWRYVYSETASAMGTEHREGEKIRVKHGDQIGHYEIEKKHPGGWLTVKHDETGQYMTVHEEELRRVFKDQNKERIDAAHDRLQRTLNAARKHGTRQQQDRAAQQLAQYRDTWGITPETNPEVPSVTFKWWNDISRDEMGPQAEALAAHELKSIEEALSDIKGRIQALKGADKPIPMMWLRWRSVAEQAITMRQERDQEHKDAGVPTDAEQGMIPVAASEPPPKAEVEAKTEPKEKKARAPRKTTGRKVAAGLQQVGDHIWGSRKDLAELLKALTTEKLDEMSFQDAAEVVRKKHLVPAYDLDQLKGFGQTPGAAHMTLALMAAITSKPGDSAAERKAYFDDIQKVLENVKNVKTADEFSLLMNEMSDERRRKPSYQTLGRYKDRNEARAAAQKIQEENPKKDIGILFSYTDYQNHVIEQLPKPYDTLGQRFKGFIERKGKVYRDARDEAYYAQRAEEGRFAEEGINNGWEYLQQRGAKKEAIAKAKRERAQSAREKAEQAGMTSRGRSEAKQEAGEVVRIGGVEVKDANPERIKEAFNLREIDYGKYLTQADREYHTMALEGAMHDFAETLGIDPAMMSFRGRLGIAMGARGRGKAAAHYEPGKTRQVINLTKFTGGGSLAHEWGHALDNIVAEHYRTGKGEAQGVFLSDIPKHSEHPPELAAAIDEVMEAIKKHPNPEQAKQAHRDAIIKARNAETLVILDNNKLVDEHKKLKSKPADEEARQKKLKNEQWYIDNYRKQLKDLGDRKGRAIESKRSNLEYWIERRQKGIEAIKKEPLQSDADKARMKEIEGEIEVLRVVINDRKKDLSRLKATDPEATEYMRSAIALGAKYWASPVELFARAFETWVDDEMRSKNRRNSYLVNDTSKPLKTGVSMGNIEHAQRYPMGEERKRINAAMKKLMAVIKDGDHLRKALKPVSDTRFMLRK